MALTKSYIVCLKFPKSYCIIGENQKLLSPSGYVDIGISTERKRLWE